jgi:hypothetical protein
MNNKMQILNADQYEQLIIDSGAFKITDAQYKKMNDFIDLYLDDIIYIVEKKKDKIKLTLQSPEEDIKLFLKFAPPQSSKEDIKYMDYWA